MPPNDVNGIPSNPRISSRRLSSGSSGGNETVSNPIDDYFRQQLIGSMRPTPTDSPLNSGSTSGTRNGIESIVDAATSSPKSLKQLADIARMMRVRDSSSFHP